MRRSVSLLLLAALLALSSGCALMDATKEFGRQTKRTFTFRPGDYRDLTEEETDDWTEMVGKEGRGNQPLEKDPDPWFANLFMSEKARGIERNVGFSH